jgi:hypothetical protein
MKYLALLVVAGLGIAQTGSPIGTPAGADTTRTVPLFRPKVVVHQEIVIPKDPFLGGALSLILPGTGQAYCGRWLKGVGFLAGAYVCYGIAGGINKGRVDTRTEGQNLTAGLFALAGLTIHVWSVLDGVNSANVHNRQLLE